MSDCGYCYTETDKEISRDLFYVIERVHSDAKREVKHAWVAPHNVGTKPEGCIYCEMYIRALMRLNGSIYEKNK